MLTVIKMSMSANGHWLVSYSSSTFTEPGFFITQNLSRGSTLWTKFLLSGKMLPVSTAKCCYVRKRRRLIRRWGKRLFPRCWKMFLPWRTLDSVLRKTMKKTMTRTRTGKMPSNNPDWETSCAKWTNSSWKEPMCIWALFLLWKVIRFFVRYRTGFIRSASNSPMYSRHWNK